MEGSGDRECSGEPGRLAAWGRGAHQGERPDTEGLAREATGDPHQHVNAPHPRPEALDSESSFTTG